MAIFPSQPLKNVPVKRKKIATLSGGVFNLCRGDIHIYNNTEGGFKDQDVSELSPFY